MRPHAETLEMVRMEIAMALFGRGYALSAFRPLGGLIAHTYSLQLPMHASHLAVLCCTVAAQMHTASFLSSLLESALRRGGTWTCVGAELTEPPGLFLRGRNHWEPMAFAGWKPRLCPWYISSWRETKQGRCPRSKSGVWADFLILGGF